MSRVAGTVLVALLLYTICVILVNADEPCGPNEEYNICSNLCRKTCRNPKFPCPKIGIVVHGVPPYCRPGCRCNADYVLNENGKCILSSECPE